VPDLRQAAPIQLQRIEPRPRQGFGLLDLVAATILPAFWGRSRVRSEHTGEIQGGERVAEISPLRSARLRRPLSQEVAERNKVRDSYPRYCRHYDATRLSPVSARVRYYPAPVVALDRDRCNILETPAPTATPTTASVRSKARKAQLSSYSPLTTVADKAQAKTPITTSAARSLPEVPRQSSHPRTALEMRGKNSSIWFPSPA